MKASKLLFAILLAVCLLMGVDWLHAQGTDLGTLRGSVTDIQGAVVVGAKVVITDLATGITVERLTDPQGNYEVPNLKSGTYKVSVSMEGFNTADVLNVVVRVGGAVRADARLSPKTVAETITVISEAPQIQMEAPVISGMLNNQQILDLPRDSRDIYQFLYLNPNITYNPDDGFKFIGAQSYGANFTMDGQRATGAGFGQAIGGQPSLETVGEIDVLSNAFSAEYAGIANIRVTTKRGTSAYHGSLFYDNKNWGLASWRIGDKIDQANFVPSYSTPTFRQPRFNFTETGGSFGGRVPRMKNKTFFMFAFEHRWDAQPVRYSSTRLPHATVMAGDFSKIVDSRKPSVPVGISLTADEIGNDTVGGLGKRFIRIPTRLLSPYTTALVNKYYPQTSPDAPIDTSRGFNRDWATTTPGLVTRPLYTGRIDHDFSDRDKIYGVVNASVNDGTFTRAASPFVALGTLFSERNNQTISLSWNHTFAPTLINEARGGLNYQTYYRRATLKVSDFLKDIGFSQEDISAYAAVAGSQAPEMWGTFPVNVGGFPAFGNMGRNADRTTEQKMWSFGDTLTWIKGRHSIRTGFDLVHNYVLDAFSMQRGYPRSSMTYGADLSGWTRFLMGLPPNSIRKNFNVRLPMMVHNWEHGYFLQDDFKVTPRLTLNLGLRYELVTPFVEENELAVNFDPTYKNPNGNLGRFVVQSKAAFSKVDPRMVTYGIATAGELGLGPGLVKTDNNNVAPRLGAAFRLTDKTVLRGGYGFYYPTSAAQGMRDAMTSSPFNQSANITSSTAYPLGNWPRAFSGGAPATLGGEPSINSIPFDLQQPRVQQFNATFERELGWKTALRVSYLGTRVWGVIGGWDLNMIQPSDNPFGTTIGDGVTPCDPVNEGNCDLSAADQARLPYPGLGDWLMAYGNIGSLHSNALQIVLDRRFANGLMFNASYTLLDQKNDVTDADSSLGDPVYNPFKPTADRGWDSFVSRHRFIAYGSYDVPFGRGRRFASSMHPAVDTLFGGWQTSFHMFSKTGTGFTPYWYCDNCWPIAPGNVFSSAIEAFGGWETSYRPLVTGTPEKKSGDLIWDYNAYATPPIGADFFDNAKVARRNSLLGPGTWAVNFALSKDFRINERMKLRLRAVFDNLFNHPTFAPIGDNSIANLGSFLLEVDPNTGRLLPITNITANEDFGRLRYTYQHEGIDDRRSIRISLRLTF